MKTKLLIATAVAAVLATTGFAAAEEQHHGGAAPAARAAPAPRAAAPRAAIQHAPSAPRAQTQIQRSAPVRTQAQVHEQRGPATNRQAQPTVNRQAQPARVGQTERNRATSDRNRRDTDRAGTETNRSSVRSSASFSTEQRSRIRQTILSGRNPPRMARPDFDVRVGYRIPRDRLHFALLPLPETVVDIEPQWQGYLYFLVGDEVVVVDPDTYEIVAVLPA
jgi:Protein of unknown function (DUF1236)